MKYIEHKDAEKALAALSEHYGLSVKVIRSRTRKAHIAQIRQTMMYIVYQYSILSLKDTATLFFRNDHTTILHAIKQTKKRFSKDPSKIIPAVRTFLDAA